YCITTLAVMKQFESINFTKRLNVKKWKGVEEYMTRQQQIAQLEKSWAEDSRWKGIERPYSAEDVVKLRGSILIDHTLAAKGADRLWKSLHEEDFINALGALTGNQAVQQVKAGLQAIYLSGWQVAADANLSGQM